MNDRWQKRPWHFFFSFYALSLSHLCFEEKKTLKQHQHRDQRQTLAFSILASASASAMRIQHPCIIPKYQFDKSRLHVFSISP